MKMIGAVAVIIAAMVTTAVTYQIMTMIGAVVVAMPKAIAMTMALAIWRPHLGLFAIAATTTTTMVTMVVMVDEVEVVFEAAEEVNIICKACSFFVATQKSFQSNIAAIEKQNDFSAIILFCLVVCIIF